MLNLVYTAKARQDLQDIYNYIAEDSKQRASEFMAELENAILKLQDFPKMGVKSKYKELNEKNYLILIHKNYLIFYKFDDKFISIIRILNGSVNYKDLF